MAQDRIAEQVADDSGAHRMSRLGQRTGKLPGTLAGPAQGRQRVTACVWADQRFQSRHQGRVAVTEAFASSTGTPDPPTTSPGLLQFPRGLVHGRTRHARGTGRPRNAAATQSTRPCGHQQPPLTLIQMQRERLVQLRAQGFGIHAQNMRSGPIPVNVIGRSFLIEIVDDAT